MNSLDRIYASSLVKFSQLQKPQDTYVDGNEYFCRKSLKEFNDFYLKK